MLARVPWTRIWTESFTVANDGSVPLGYVELPTILLYPTFRVVCSPTTVGGTLSVNVRLGFTQADAAVAEQGVFMPSIFVAPNSSRTASPAWSVTGLIGSTDFRGSPGIIPPICAVFMQAEEAIGVLDLGVDLYFTGLSPE